MTGHPYVDEAIPHEAGHIVVGWIVGMPITETPIEIVCKESRTQPGNFITKSVEPSNEQIAQTPPRILKNYALMLAGGVAGNNFVGMTASDHRIEDDRRKLAHDHAEPRRCSSAGTGHNPGTSAEFSTAQVTQSNNGFRS